MFDVNVALTLTRYAHPFVEICVVFVHRLPFVSARSLCRNAMLSYEQRIERADFWRATAIEWCVGAVWYREHGPDPKPVWFPWSADHTATFARRRWLRAGRVLNALLDRHILCAQSARSARESHQPSAREREERP